MLLPLPQDWKEEEVMGRITALETGCDNTAGQVEELKSQVEEAESAVVVASEKLVRTGK